MSPGRHGSSGVFWPAVTGSRYSAAAGWCRWRGKPAPATAIATRGRSASMRDIDRHLDRAPDWPRRWWANLASPAPCRCSRSIICCWPPDDEPRRGCQRSAPGNGQPGDNLLAWRAGSAGGRQQLSSSPGQLALDASQPPTPCCCRGGRAYAGSASRCGAMNTANGWRQLSRRSAGRSPGRCRWIGLPAGEGGARAWDRHRVMPAVTDSGYRAAGAVRHP